MDASPRLPRKQTKMAAGMTSVSHRRGDSQFQLRVSPVFAPDFQLSAGTFRALAHAGQTVVTGAPFLAKHIRIDSGSVVPHPDAKLPYIVPDFHFDSPRPRVVERVAQRLARNAVDVIPQDRMQVLWSTLNFQRQNGRLPVGSFLAGGHELERAELARGINKAVFTIPIGALKEIWNEMPRADSALRRSV